jgi:tellurite resistance protein TerC
MGTWTLWIAFNSGVALLLLLDLGVFHRRAHTISLREAALQSVAWITVSVGFGSWIFFSHGRGPGLEFFTGYLIEQSLSMDNVFVFLLIFQYFRVDSRYQHRLLFWGVLGAFVMRGVMIGAGVILIQRFAWVLYLFGAFLLYAGLKLFRADQAGRRAEAVCTGKRPVACYASFPCGHRAGNDGSGLRHRLDPRGFRRHA